MDESYTSLPTSHLLGSVPAVISDEKKIPVNDVSNPAAHLQIFPPNSGDRGRGYQSLGNSNGGDEQQATSNWNGYLSISSYTQYFNVETDVVLERIRNSLYPVHGDFFRKIGNNPDLYGTIWIATTLIFVIAALGNCATYLIRERSDKTTPWIFDVSYLNVAAGGIYGYTLIAPAAYHFLLQYLGLNTSSLVRFWCMWGYSLFIFIPASFLLVIPLEFLRWIVIIASGSASASFVALNLKSEIQASDLNVVLVSSFVLQLALALFIKIWFFP
ncbi:hypothetical protein ACHQM5_020143 [Ranunculus cassubicifolius]